MHEQISLYLYLDQKYFAVNTKLTLTIEQEIINRAKKYAKDKNRSLSDIVEKYLKVLTNEKQNAKDNELNPIVKSLKGSFKMPKKDMDYKVELRDRLAEKIFLDGEIEVILSRNIKDYQKSRLSVLTPEAYLKGLVSS